MRFGTHLKDNMDIIVVMQLFFFGVTSSFSLFNKQVFNELVQPELIRTPTNDEDISSSSSEYVPVSSSLDNTESSYSIEEQEPLDTLMFVCARVSKHIDIGTDEMGLTHQMDIGQCSHVATSTNDIQSGKNVVDICDLDSPCNVSSIIVERNYLLGGKSQYDVIEGCTCRKIPHKCRRVPLMKTFFPSSPFEVAVDIGTCAGDCQKDDCDGCFPTRFVTTTVQGPNGDECIKKTEECSCTNNCYRASRFETYYVESWDSSLNSTVVKPKTFDVGMCMGRCPPTPFCFIRDQSSGNCLSTLNTNSKCSPTSFTRHSFTTPEGTERLLLSIGNCVCV
ncbi:hypothetical protein HOLleu_37771 [Holothuria leucospilota]|uniref:Uncharacterized protein n=1 Tax=Holothuria leucospilota TaxID=206669 RepID=A0A9Q0YK05_HOLLE|nr:hypothetical protein HOLleu_37771 [Holothuria leucospilota]